MHKTIARHKNGTLVYWLKVLWIMSSPALLKQTLSVRVESASQYLKNQTKKKCLYTLCCNPVSISGLTRCIYDYQTLHFLNISSRLTNKYWSGSTVYKHNLTHSLSSTWLHRNIGINTYILTHKQLLKWNVYIYDSIYLWE